MNNNEMMFEVKSDEEKKETLENQDFFKDNFDDISDELKKMVEDSSDHKLSMKDKKFYKDHEDHKEQHYLLEFRIDSDDLSDSEKEEILKDIGDKVEKAFNSNKKDLIDKGLYFDNKKKDDTTRFVELHYDFYPDGEVEESADDIFVYIESAGEYINNDDFFDITESLQDSVINLKTKIVIGTKLRKTIIKIALMSAKLKHLSKSPEKNKLKIMQIKKDLIAAEKEKRELISKLPSEAKKEVKKIENKAKEEANKSVKSDSAKKVEESMNNTISMKGYVTDSGYMGLMRDGKYHKFENEGAYKESFEEEDDETSDIKESSKDDHYVKKYKDEIEKNEKLLEEYEKDPKKNRNKIEAIKKIIDDYKKKLSVVKESADSDYKKEIEDAVDEAINELKEVSDAANKIANDPEFRDFCMTNMRESIAALKRTEEEAIREAAFQQNLVNQQLAFCSTNDIEDNDIIFEKSSNKSFARNLLTKEERIFNKFKAKLEKIPGISKRTTKSISDFIKKKRKTLDKLFSQKTITEAANIESEMKPIVDTLNRKGYKVKYSSPGHKKLRKKEDGEPDGVYYGKLYSDARIMFAGKYKLPKAPKYWYFRDVEGNDYLDIEPITYKEVDGTPDEAFNKWKDEYMASLRDWANSLKDSSNAEGGKEVEASKDKKPVKESTDFYSSLEEVKEYL